MSLSRGAVREVHRVERVATLEYSPELDGKADPGEIVWTWVPYEEDPGQGKDRPLLVIGRHGERLLGMMLSSKAHDTNDWLPLGPGAWDRDDRDSYLRLDRVFELDENDLRREGAIMAPAEFAEVAAVLMNRLGWRVRH
ncbi:MAG: type II toxin-antitoxin system PemK/MazF family toxin [Streptosporangiaceae bacterium]